MKQGKKMDKIKVLIVDDEVEFATAVAERLEIRNFFAEVVDCGRDALLSLESSVPDIVLLDLKMPDMSGLEVLKKIKEMHPEVEVIMLTGHGSAASGLSGKELGAFDYMMKPVDFGELVETIKLAHKKQQRAITAD